MIHSYAEPGGFDGRVSTPKRDEVVLTFTPEALVKYVKHAQAEAWDDGHVVGYDDAVVDSRGGWRTHPGTPNPYRDHAEADE